MKGNEHNFVAYLNQLKQDKANQSLNSVSNKDVYREMKLVNIGLDKLFALLKLGIVYIGVTQFFLAVFLLVSAGGAV